MTLVAWLEVWVGVPYWYIMAIRNCIANGAMLNVSLRRRWKVGALQLYIVCEEGGEEGH